MKINCWRCNEPFNELFEGTKEECEKWLKENNWDGVSEFDEEDQVYSALCEPCAYKEFN